MVVVEKKGGSFYVFLVHIFVCNLFDEPLVVFWGYY